MKKNLTTLTIILLSSVISFGQTVSLNGTVFKIGDKLPVRPILFHFAESSLLAESYPYLDSVAYYLLQNNNLALEVGVHTDSRGSDKYSTCLSCNRAKAIVNYLISKGIQSDRLLSKGYNATEPLVSDEKIKKLKTKEEIEKAHQINRRTEFKIIRTDYVEGMINLTNLYDVKVILSGQWYKYSENDTIIENFTFNENTFHGECKSKNYISKSPVFTIIREDNKTVIRWTDITGSEFDYVILELKRDKMIVQYNNTKIEYKKNAL